MEYNIKNPQKNTDGSISVELYVDSIGWVPFNSIKNHPEKKIADIYEQAELIVPVLQIEENNENVSDMPVILNHKGFEFFLAYTGLDDVWDLLEKSLKGTNRAAYAGMKALRLQRDYELTAVLKKIKSLSPDILKLDPSFSVDEKELQTAWKLAAGAM